MVSKEYRKLRAANLLKLAQSTKDPELAASLIARAADHAAEAEKLPAQSTAVPGPPHVKSA
jgi:hypothetical protein